MTRVPLEELVLMKVAVVVTSIAPPNSVLAELARGSRESDYDFIVIGDEPSPVDFAIPGCRFFGLAEQHALQWDYARKCPTRHYARKNIGYLLALSAGAEIIIETDDDNFPKTGFWAPRERQQQAASVLSAGWVNAYRFFSDANI